MIRIGYTDIWNYDFPLYLKTVEELNKQAKNNT